MHSDGMTDQPVTMQWDGEAFKPVNDFWAKRCDKLFVIGERYAIVEHHERSMASHKHYFSLIAEAWLNLPEKLAGEFPNPESLRKYALITAGYCTGNKIVCRDEDEARAMILLVRQWTNMRCAIPRVRLSPSGGPKANRSRPWARRTFKSRKTRF
jgi:hypothetical protein